MPAESARMHHDLDHSLTYTGLFEQDMDDVGGRLAMRSGIDDAWKEGTLSESPPPGVRSAEPCCWPKGYGCAASRAPGRYRARRPKIRSRPERSPWSVAHAGCCVPPLSRRATAPGQGALQLDLQGEAEERSDQDDQPEREGAVDRGIDSDRLHDVSDDQDLQAQENRPTDILSG